ASTQSIVRPERHRAKPHSRWMSSQPSLSDILKKQRSVIARRQVLVHLSERALDRRIRKGGPWQVLLPGVYGAFTGHPTQEQRMQAAVLYAGKGAFITGP